MKKLSLTILLLGLTTSTGFSTDSCKLVDELLEKKTKTTHVTVSAVDIRPNVYTAKYTKLFNRLNEDIEKVSESKTELDIERDNCESLRLHLPKESLAELQARKVALEKQLKKMQEISSSSDEEDEYKISWKVSGSKKCNKKHLSPEEKLKEHLKETKRKIGCYDVFSESTKRLDRLETEALAARNNAQMDIVRIKSARSKLDELLPKAIAARQSQYNSECAAIDESFKIWISPIKLSEASNGIEKLATAYMQSLKKHCKTELDTDITSFRLDYKKRYEELQYLNSLAEFWLLQISTIAAGKSNSFSNAK